MVVKNNLGEGLLRFATSHCRDALTEFECFSGVDLCS